jgi:hypothetical protein
LNGGNARAKCAGVFLFSFFMPLRIQVSTDVAAIGIWDRSQPVARVSNAGTLEELAQQGEACIVRLGADWAGAVNVFVDEQFPADVLAESLPIVEERTIVVRSGEIVIDGLEYFGGSKTDEEEASSVVRLRNGTYRTNIRVTKRDDELSEPGSENELRRLLGADEVEYYDRANRNGLLLGLSTLLILPVLLFLVPWYVAVPIALVVFVSYFHVRERLLKRNERYQKLAERIVAWRLAGERPFLSIQLSMWDGKLLGGPPIDGG